MAKRISDYPSSANFGQHGGGLIQDYKEDIFVGYRYFKTFGSENVVFPFGHGLSYTNFKIDNIRFEKSDIPWAEMSEEERSREAANIRNGLNYARKVLDTGERDLLVMDDVLGLIDNGIITFEEMGELLEHREETDVVLTGTRMDDGLCRFAGEIKEITDCPFCCFEGK